MKITSDDEIRFHTQIEVPAGVQIECAEVGDGGHVLTIGGSVFSGPRLILELHSGTAADLLAAVREALETPGA